MVPPSSRRFRPAFLAAAALCLRPLAAQEAVEEPGASLEALLNTRILVASKTPESVQEAPGIVTVVTRKEIEGFAARNLGQVLNRVVGMNLLSPDIFPYQSVVVRGQEATPYNNHILVLLDGRPMRDPITGGLDGSYWNAFPLDALERVEIIRGPGSVLYGSCAYSGVVNLITRSRVEDGIEGTASVLGGSQGAFAQAGTLLCQKGDFRGLLSVAQFTDSGPRESFADYGGQSGSARFFHHALGAVAHLAGPGWTFNAWQGSYNPYTLEGADESWKSPPTRDAQATTHLDAGCTRELTESLGLSGNLTYNRTGWYTGERWPTQAPAFPQATTQGRAVLAEVMARYSPGSRFHLLVGGGYEKDRWDGALVISGEQDSSFLYAQADARLDAVKLIGGFQYNKLEGIGGNTSPRLGAIWEIDPRWSAKLLYSTAFRKGYPNETSFNVAIFHGNPHLQPELIATTEAQASYQGRAFQGAVTVYQSRMTDIIIRRTFPAPGLDPPVYLKYLNGGSWNFHGVELEGRWTLGGGLLASGSATWQANRTGDGQDDANLQPSTQVKAGLLYEARAWSLGLFDVWSSGSRPTTTVDPDSRDLNPQPGAYHLISLKASWRAWSRGGRSLTLALESNDLLNSYVTFSDYPNKTVNSLLPLYAGRTVDLSATCRF